MLAGVPASSITMLCSGSVLFGDVVAYEIFPLVSPPLLVFLGRVTVLVALATLGEVLPVFPVFGLIVVSFFVYFGSVVSTSTSYSCLSCLLSPLDDEFLELPNLVNQLKFLPGSDCSGWFRVPSLRT